MSLTSVVEARTTSSSLFQTPTKRKRSSPAPRPTLPSTADIYAWVLTSGAIAPCFVCDIRVMRHHYKPGGEEFWWLKRVPCRSVKIVGTVVGIQPYEKRISYTIDDGTSVIECIHNCGRPVPPSPKKQGAKKPSNTNDLLPPKPVAWIGQTVEVIGRIYEFDTKDSESSFSREPREPRRQLKVQKIAKCKSVNEKLFHWQTVLDLHASSYSLSEPFLIPETPIPGSSPGQHTDVSTPSDVLSPPGPLFVISTSGGAPSTPSAASDAASTSSKVLSSPIAALSTPSTVLSTPSQVLSTPSTVLSTPSAVLSTPSTVLSTPSAVLSTPSTVLSAPSSTLSTLSSHTEPSPVKRHASPIKLRHPSRLHTPDLTNHTFRFYVKHVLDNPPALEEELFDGSLAGSSTTTRPTRRRQPFQRLSSVVDTDATPRPTRGSVSFVPRDTARSASLKGFTLSYLRRVPELSQLAERVVKADAKRRDKEARKKLKDATRSQSSRSQGHSSRASERSNSSMTLGKAPLSTRITQLWQDTIVQLCEDGEVVLWDGPTYPIGCSNCRIWKSATSTSANTTVSSDVSALSSISSLQEDEEEIDLPDPEPNEDAYIVLTPEVLVEHIELVIHNWITRGRSGGTPKFTAEGILQALKRDDRWRRVGSWHVKDAMELLVDKGWVDPISDERWSLSQGQTSVSQR
ncbi:hypothetical protein GYMLUDRAFT_40659 [Collybiopsis luxurians FD-317 M1]|uniref:CST complex subunit STN1 n=1 Tax=Collybiopsis luxurians FD-317 M1 TaxID=944289 RepID=A0A0D0C669_9AGAR|nr:hypothetical protein GYMLUDRAFT_40659 [Collybiopsis luxurians FD-317 M1]